jgi:hypothetical protein
VPGLRRLRAATRCGVLLRQRYRRWAATPRRVPNTQRSATIQVAVPASVSGCSRMAGNRRWAPPGAESARPAAEQACL